MLLEIFDVEHGACALITTSNGKRLMVDCGHNATTKWRPGDAMRRAGIATIDRLFITNFDEDHVSGFTNLVTSTSVRVLVTNPTVNHATIRQLKTEDGMGPGIDALSNWMEQVFVGGAPSALEDFGDASFKVFYNPFGIPPFGFDDENNLSLVVFVACGHHKIIFPGDMEKAGWQQLLCNLDFVRELQAVNIFVASHHGRENGYCEDVMRLCPNIRAVIISDQKMGFQTQETLDLYRRHASGIVIDGEYRRVLTTRRDASMQFNLPPAIDGNVRVKLIA